VREKTDTGAEGVNRAEGSQTLNAEDGGLVSPREPDLRTLKR
jgi:hypothetical protein